jgi:hypothetical protein
LFAVVEHHVQTDVCGWNSTSGTTVAHFFRRPMCVLAVLRLMTRSNFVGCITGRSIGALRHG